MPERLINYNRKVLVVRTGSGALQMFHLAGYCFVAEVPNTELVRLGKLNLWMKSEAVKTWLTLRRQIPVKSVKPF